MRRSLHYSLATALALGSLGLGAATASAQGLVLKLAHDNRADPFDNPGHACAQVLQNIVQSDTNGEITVEIYPSNQVGEAIEQVQMVRDDIIQATIASTGALASYYPNIDVLNLPFAFAHNAATYTVFDGAFGHALKADMEEYLGDAVVLGFPDTGGFFALTNSVREVATLSDFEGLRVRTMTLPSHQVIMSALGVESYPLAWGEVYSALQTGVIDGQMNPVPIISFSNFSEVQDYLTLTNHLFSPYTLLLSRNFWESLDERQQEILRYAAHSCVEASRGIARVIEASERGLTGLQDTMQVTALSAEDRETMREVTQPAFEEHIENELGEDALELLALFKQEVEAANSRQYMYEAD